MTTLLIEEIDFDSIDCLVLTEQKEKKYMIRGPFIEANTQNKNKRIYPSPIVRPQVELYQEKIKSGRSAGELNHPNTLEINPENVSHRTVKLEFDGKNIVMGEALIGEKGKGAIVRGLMDLGLKLGVSSRGAGTLKEGVVQKDYKYVCNDIVWEPSAPSAFVEGIIESDTEWIVENGILVEKDIDEIQAQLSDFRQKDINKVMIDILEWAINRAGKNVVKDLLEV